MDRAGSKARGNGFIALPMLLQQDTGARILLGHFWTGELRERNFALQSFISAAVDGYGERPVIIFLPFYTLSKFN